MKTALRNWLLNSGVVDVDNNTYVDLPTTPTFSTTKLLDHTIILNSVETTEVTGFTDLLVKNPYSDRLRPNNLQGTLGTPYRFKSESDSIRTWVGGDVVTTAQQVSGMLNNPTYNYFYHLGFVGNSDTVETGITACQPTAKAGGSTFIYEDIVVKDVTFAGLQVNSTTGTVTSLTASFFRVFGHNTDGEGFYIGNTGKVTYAITDYFSATDVFVYDKGRDGLQFNSIADLNLDRATVYDVGKAAIASQQALIQVQNCNGLITNSVFWGAVEFGTIGTHNVTFRNCVFYADARGYINKLTTDYTSSPHENNLAIVFDACYFFSPNSIAEVWRVQEDEADVTFTNCVKGDNITNLYLDFRTDTVTYTLSESGTTSMATPAAPSFNSLDPDNDNAGLNRTQWMYDLGMGYRIPAIVNPFDPWTDIAWTDAFDFSTSLDLVNKGVGNDATAPTAPVYSGAEEAVRFTRASSQYLRAVATVAYNVPVETWIVFKTPSSFSGSQIMYATSNTHRIECISTSNFQLSGTDTGNALSTSTWYTARVILNGASSEYQLYGVVGLTAISLSTSSIGTPSSKIGAANGLFNYFDGHIKYIFTKVGSLSAGEITNMETWLGV
jgi:hypothetical protein